MLLYCGLAWEIMINKMLHNSKVLSYVWKHWDNDDIERHPTPLYVYIPTKFYLGGDWFYIDLYRKHVLSEPAYKFYICYAPLSRGFPFELLHSPLCTRVW